MNDADVLIIGAGLTGLRAALELSRSGYSVLIVERDGVVGGRLKTTIERGLVMDHGFQVLLSGYPELKSLPPLDVLGCRDFWSGARMRLDSKQYDLLNPLKHPRSLPRSIASPVASLRDLLKLARFVYSGSAKTAQFVGDSTANVIDSARYSETFKGAFLKPFLRGVLLDQSLTTDAGLARFYLRIFSSGAAQLPAKGIQALPNYLADVLGRQHILLNTVVSKISAKGVVLDSGEELHARHVVCAVDALSAAALGANEQTAPHCGNVTVYLLAEHPPYTEPLITLNGDGRGPVNNLAILTNVQPSYAPEGQALLALSVIGDAARQPHELLMTQIRDQMHSWFGAQSADWEHIRTFTISNALPARPRMSQGWYQQDGIYYAGDYLSYGSQNGALAAGRAVAQAVADL
ncbi:MAG: NAD(P)/FAD-dependent oxidoreductase [Pseudomonadota bacterium]|jgi:phytoene dehydrogenase-like protein